MELPVRIRIESDAIRSMMHSQLIEDIHVGYQRTEQPSAVLRAKSSSLLSAPTVFMRLIKRIHKRVYAQQNRFFRRFGSSYPEYDILMILYSSPELSVTPSEVAEVSGEKPANITRLTDLLCEKGYICRGTHREDRRKTALTLQPAGTALVERVLPELGELLKNQIVRFSDEELFLLESLLNKLLVSID